MLRKLMNTQNDYSLAIARLLLGVVFFAHGAQKMLGWFGGLGFSGPPRPLCQTRNADCGRAVRDFC